MVPTIKVATSSGMMASDIYSEEYARRKIYITGEITDALSADVCAQISALASQSKEDITLIIQSPGGSVSAGMAILDTMDTCGCDISTVVMGVAASMGAVLASSGTKGKRFIGSNAEMMIHQALGGASGQTADILRTAEHIQRINKRLYNILAKNTGKSYKKICADCDRDYYLDSQTAINYGLADKIFEGFEE